MQIQTVGIDELVPFEKNPRSLTQHDFESLQRSIEEWGFVEPIVANKRNNHIVGGHQRWRAARELGHTEVPVVWVALDNNSEIALNIALNKISGAWDEELLNELLLELDDEMTILTGFTDEEIAELSADPFDEPDEPKDDKSKVVKYSVPELRDLAKSYHPLQSDVIIEFLNWLDERSKDR